MLHMFQMHSQEDPSLSLYSPGINQVTYSISLLMYRIARFLSLQKLFLAKIQYMQTQLCAASPQIY